MHRNNHLIVPVLALCAGLAGCGDEPQEDLRAWMEVQARDMRGRVQPLPEIKFDPVSHYEGESRTDPFVSSRIEPEKKPSSAAKPDMNRRKEPLENYPLESIRMVGSLIRGNERQGLVQVDKTVFQVRVGNHLGQNYGVVTAVTEGEIVLKEVVEDGAGEWAERVSRLMLQEKQEGKK